MGKKLISKKDPKKKNQFITMLDFTNQVKNGDLRNGEINDI